MTADLGDLASAEQLQDEIMSKYGRIDAVVASIGGTWHRNVSMTEVLMDEWNKFLFTNLTTHFVTAKTFLPILAHTEGSSYTFLGGGAANTVVSKLTDAPESGVYRVLTDLKGEKASTISRADVASFLVQQIDSQKYLRQTPLITN